MLKSKDEEINKILSRAEKYREQYNEKITNKNNYNFNLEMDSNFGAVFKEFFDKFKNYDYNDKNNVFINCKLKQEELKNGCTKIIKYKYMDKNNKKILQKLEVKIPKNIKERQKIVIHNCGNYIKEQNRYSHLIINIVKNEH